ncbi:MAG: exopolyphosphatase [Chitinophagaceae bacterium]|jgi:exopolyphosphatase/guanosine-5'-triphosphate,3'-diphosphate pyrophosphatase|nr:exopolyphosphatase [Bacteroidota bacterium]MBK9555132.1 exopolyphosphatase [Bacteroidota bacterium]MBP9880549.1 exopolyphosphatase [Chitinophagales bacterium]
MKFAAIDIGSNAIRLLIENVYETPKGPVFHKDSLIRVPVRLGEDAFIDGVISEEKTQMLVKAMISMKHIMEIHKVTAFKVCATSAMRDAKNSDEILARVKKEAGLEIQIISGDREGKTILGVPLDQIGLEPNDFYLYIDVGGGSTELGFLGNGKLIANRSFNIGTLRLLNDQVNDTEWREMLEWIKATKNINFELSAIGVGGNINHVMKHYGKAGKPYLSISILKRVMMYMDDLSMGERVRELGLKPDRADVIVPALKIYINVMKWAGIEKIFVPKQGLSDGLISQLYHEWKSKTIEV